MKYTVSIIEREFTPKEAEGVTGVSVTTQRDWRRRELLPEKEGEGWSVYRLINIVEMLAMKMLSESGVPLATAKQIASMSKMPVLSEFRRYPVNFAFEGRELSEASRARIIDGSTSPVRGRYLVVPLPASDDLLYKVARGDDVQDLLDHTSKKAGQAAHHLVVDHLAVAQRVMVAVDGPVYRVVSEEVIE